MDDAGGDLFLRQQHHIVEQIATHGEGQPVVEADAAAERIRQRRHLLHLYRVAGVEAGLHRRPALHRNADDFR
jgi:hypothetical protein